jgi:hypothetical protein
LFFSGYNVVSSQTSNLLDRCRDLSGIGLVLLQNRLAGLGGPACSYYQDRSLHRWFLNGAGLGGVDFGNRGFDQLGRLACGDERVLAVGPGALLANIDEFETLGVFGMVENAQVGFAADALVGAAIANLIQGAASAPGQDEFVQLVVSDHPGDALGGLRRAGEVERLGVDDGRPMFDLVEDRLRI